MSGSRTTPSALKQQKYTLNNEHDNITDEHIIQETYGSNTPTPVPSITNSDDNKPILMEDTVRDSEELALTAKDDIETAKLIVSQQNLSNKNPKPSSASSPSTKNPNNDNEDKSRELIKIHHLPIKINHELQNI